MITCRLAGNSSLPGCQTYGADTRELDLTIGCVPLDHISALANSRAMFSHACTTLVDEAR
jgi:hypothetical protein